MTQPTTNVYRWRTVDIVVTAVIAVAFGVIFWAWDLLWSATDSAFAFFPPAQALLYGVYLLPAVLAGLLVRKPGAAVFAETIAAMISAFLGNKWGATVIPQGIIEGLGAELAFVLVIYRSYRLPVVLASGALAGLAATMFDAIYWYPSPDYSWTSYKLPYVGIGVVSSLVIAGLGAIALVRALAPTGAVDRFAAGRERVSI